VPKREVKEEYETLTPWHKRGSSGVGITIRKPVPRQQRADRLCPKPEVKEEENDEVAVPLRK
jgi:hypothetical protein